MPAPTEHELDARLRAMATRSISRVTDGIDVDADLLDVHHRATNHTLQRRADQTPSRRWIPAAAAAALLIVTAGAVIAVSQPDDDGEIETAAVETSVSQTTVALPPMTSLPATTPAATFVSETAVDTTVFDPTQLATATATPATVGPGEYVTITPSAAIAYCGMGAVLVAAIQDGALIHVGTIEYGAYTSPPVRQGCDTGASGDGPVGVQIPGGLNAGEHVLCLSDLVVAGCAHVTVTAEMTGAAACTGDPLPPPSLADGSPVGEPTFTTDESGAQIATWGAGRAVAISQVVGALPDLLGESNLSTPRAVGDYTATFEYLADGYLLHVRGPSDFCPRSYRFTAAVQVSEWQFTPLWLEFYANGTPVPNGYHQAQPAPADYFGFRWDPQAGALVTHRFSTTGVDLGPIDPSTHPANALADGRRVELTGDFPPGCFNQPLELIDGGQRSAVHPDLQSAFSFAVTPDGVLVAARLVCDGDTVLGWQLVRTDLRRPESGIEVLDEQSIEDAFEIPTAMGQIAWKWVRSVSDDGRFIGLSQPYNTEQSRFMVVDAHAPSEPITLASTCPTAGDIVSTPGFAGDVVVLARWCEEGDAVTVAVDQIQLPTMELIDGTRITTPMLPSYGNTVGLSVFDDDPSTFIISGSVDVEAPNTSILVVDGQQVDISRPLYQGFSFEPLIGV